MRRGWHTLEPGTKFQPGWAVDAVCEHLEAVSSGEITRLLINIPPGCTKSMTANVFWQAWEWGPRAMPHLRYISASYEQGLSVRDMVRCRDLINSEWYQLLWGDRFEWKGDVNAKTLYENNYAGWRYAGSVGGSLIGRRADRIVIDDPHDTQKVESDKVRANSVRWFAETLPTRVNDQERSPIVVIMQRLHERDISGHILSKELGYTHLCLPMNYEPDHPYRSSRFVDPRKEAGEWLWPERFTPKAIEELKKTFRSFGGPYAEAGQLQQRPAPRGGGLFKEKDFKYRDMPALDEIVRIVRGWDLAMTDANNSPYTVGLKLALLSDESIMVLDITRGQWGPGEVYSSIRATAERDGPRVRQSLPQDPAQAGKDQKRHLAAYLAGCNLHFSPESGDKELRAQGPAGQCAGGNLYLLKGAPWLDEFVAEAKVFPRGEFLDQIDALSRAYALLIGSREQMLAAAPRVVR